MTEATGPDDDWQAWRAEREIRLREPHGFLAVTGLHWLGGEPQRFADVPGAWTADADGVTVELAEGEALRLDGVELRGRCELGPVDEAGRWAEFAGGTGPWGSVVEIADRFGSAILRPRHPDAPTLLGYRGTPAYPPDPRWRVTARFEPFATPRPTSVGTVIEGATSSFAAVGTLAFELDGPQRMLAFDGGEGEGDGAGLWILFRDATAGVTTHVIRSVQAGAPDAEGRVVLDFNRATNMPCAYTPYATCPLPPPENVLGVAIEAGERLPLTAG